MGYFGRYKKTERNTSSCSVFRAGLIVPLLALVLVSSLQADVEIFGYTGLGGPDGEQASEVAAINVPVNVGTVLFEERPEEGIHWTHTDLQAISTAFQAHGLKMGLTLDDVLFIKKTVNSSDCWEEANNVYIAWRLRGNWQARLQNFVTMNAQYIDVSSTSYIAVAQEVNNGCFSMAQIETAAASVKSYFPNIPVAMGYGFTGANGQAAPSSIPSSIDWVGLFKYGTFDPNNPNHPYNADGEFLNEYNKLFTRLAAHQRIVLIPDGYWSNFHRNLPSHNGNGWPRWYLGEVVRNYENFARTRPEVVGLIVFTWNSFNFPEGSTCSVANNCAFGTEDLPASVHDAHREVGCAHLGGPTCP